MKRFEIEVSSDMASSRIDKYLSDVMEGYTRSHIARLIEEGLVLVSGRSVKASYKVSAGDTITVDLPEPEAADIKAEDIELDILYEDSDILVVNKPQGMVVHPAPGHYCGTLVNALMYHCADDLSGINGVLRPGIVHRIDRDTSGVLVVCKNDVSHNNIAEQLSSHSIKRLYRAIVYNNIEKDSGCIDTMIGRMDKDRKKMCINPKNGKRAITHFRVLERFGSFTYIECELETGRTHQIRVHMASVSHPLLGDTVYGPSKDKYGLNGQTLHAKCLCFVHPTTGEYMEFDTELPEYFQRILDSLRATGKPC